MGESKALVFGRKTYELMATFWPKSIGKQPMQGTARRINAPSKIVFTKTLKEVDREGGQIAQEVGARVIEKLKAEASG